MEQGQLCVRLFFDQPPTKACQALPQVILLIAIKGGAWRRGVLWKSGHGLPEVGVLLFLFVCMVALTFLNLYSLCVFVSFF